MNPPDLDQLRQRWQQAHEAVEPQLRLDVDALRQGVLHRSRRAFASHSRWLLASLLGQASVLAALLVFLSGHWHDAIYRFLAMPMAMLALAQVIVSLAQWWTLRRLDLAAPVLEVRRQLERLRRRQLTVTRWIILSSVLLWLPMLLVLCKGVTGFDLLEVLHPSVIYVNLVVGAAFLLLGELVLRWVAWRFSGSPALQRLLVETAGRSWQRAEQAFDARADLERSLDEHGAADTVAQYRRRAELPVLLRAPMRRLRWRLVLVACFYASLMLAMGVFNATQGDQPAFIVPGVLLHLFWVAQMIAVILHRERLGRLDFAIAPEQLGAQIDALAARHLNLARISLWLAPVFVLLVAQVLGKAVLGMNLLGGLPATARIFVALVAVLGCVALSRPRAQPALARPARIMLFGVAGLSAALRRAVG